MPFVKVSVGVCATPSTEMVTVPVGVPLLDETPMVKVTFWPILGVVVEGVMVVVVETSDVPVDMGQAFASRFRSKLPSPVARS